MAQYELNLRDYARIFFKRKWVIILTATVAGIWSSLFLYTQKPTYKSSTTVKIVERKSIAGLLTEWIVYDPADLMASQSKIITGFPIIKKVAEDLGMITSSTPVEEADRVVVGLQGQITAEQVGSTNLIKITAHSSTPRGAMDLANSIARIYVDESLKEKRKQSSTARKFIEDQLSQLENRLAEGEERLRQFDENVPDIKLIQAYQQKLLDLEFELNTLLQKYTDNHPKVIRLRDQISDLKKQLKTFSGQELEYAGIMRDVEVNKKLYGMMKEKLEEARITEAQKVEDVSIVDPAVLPQTPVSAQRGMRVMASVLGGIILGVAIAFIMETFDTSMGTIEDVEKLLSLPILGVIPSASQHAGEDEPGGILGRLRNTLIPRKEKVLDERMTRLVMHYAPTSNLAEAYRNIRTNLKLSPEQKCIMVTSASPKEGKSTVLVNLGLAYAQKGLKTLVVSTDLRRPVLARTFGVKKEPGLTEVVSGTVPLQDGLRSVSDIMMGDIQLQDIVKAPGLGNLWLFPCGHLIINPSELLESKEFVALVRRFREEFDIILFDSPPILSISDASLLVPKVDLVIMCYEVGKTSRHALLRAKSQLELVGANLAGVVLNHISAQSQTLQAYSYFGMDYNYKTIDPDAVPGEK